MRTTNISSVPFQVPRLPLRAAPLSPLSRTPALTRRHARPPTPSRHLGVEVAAFDIQTQRMDVYGTGEGHAERLMVIYDGLHYDSLALAPFPGAGEDLDVTLLPARGPRTEEVAAAAATLVAAAHAARQFTDTGSFTLRCGVCGTGLRGEREALQHARATGHADFAEY